MAKGSVRKKGKKWYYRFYIEDESGRQVQWEFAGTESKSETEALLRKAMEDYEEKKFVAKSENATVAMLLDMWVEEELKPSNLSKRYGDGVCQYHDEHLRSRYKESEAYFRKIAG